jgi:hypothetical protein
MAGMPEMQEQFPAGACMADIPKNEVPLHGTHAENAGAISGGCLHREFPEKRSARTHKALLFRSPASFERQNRP